MSEKFSQMVYAYAYNGTIVTEVEQEDPYNSVRVRNADNVNQFAFNCGGYALETFNWFLPIMNESSIAENAEEKWLISNGFDSYWAFQEMDTPNQDELDDYVQTKVSDGETDILDLLSEIELPEGISIEDATEEALQLYNDHNYNTPVAVRIAALNMLKVFSDMREINGWEELNPDEYGIAYRGSDHDFHFVKYDQLKDQFSHKMGYYEVENLPTMEAGFDPEGYNSETIYFAKKRAVQCDSKYRTFCIS